MSQPTGQLLRTITVPRFKTLLRDILLNPPRMGALGIEGGPGIGKTEIIRSVAAEVCPEVDGKHISIINAGLTTPGDLNGALFPEKDTGRSVFFPLDRLLHPKRPTFIDEITNGDRQVFSGLSNLIVDGEIPGHSVSYTKPRLFAFNPPAVSDLAQDVPVIIRGRADIYQLLYTSEDMLDFALSPEGSKRFHPVVAAWIQDRGDSVLQVRDFTPHRMYGVDLPNTGDPFPSPRSYELLSDRLWRLENGAIEMPVVNLSNAAIGSIGKSFADYYLLSAYMPSIAKIIHGDAVEFPDKAFLDGRVLTPVAFMTVFSTIVTATNKQQFANVVEWMFTQFKNDVLDKEIVVSFCTAAKRGTVHDAYQYDVIQEVGKEVLGVRGYLEFVKLLTTKHEEASNIQ